MKYDVAIVGGGIAGASLAAEISRHARVLVLEAEDRPGYHSTGRSAAFWSETYGGPDIQPLTTASGALLSAGGYLDPMGSLHIGRADEAPAIDALLAEFEGTGVALTQVDPRTRIAGLRAEWTLGVLEPSCEYIDVGRLHDDYLKAMKRAGGEIRLSAGLESAVRAHGVWQIETRAGSFEADILVNAAGAWADPVARACGVAPLGIQPYRRTIMQLKTDPAPPEGSPMVAHIGGSFYWKPEAGGRLWLSPHDETACDACDSQPEDLDVAIGIDRFEHVVDWRVEKLEHKWAGLRSFAPDRLPVYGFDARSAFFWCAGQGGFGIQTAPAAAKLAAAILLGQPLDGSIAGLDRSRYSPARFGR